MIDSYLLRDILAQLIFLSGKSPRKIALELHIDTGAWSQWLKYMTPGRVGKEKLEKAAEHLGLDSETGKLLSGVHRWIVPSPLIEDVLQAESIIQKFLPGGGTIYPVQRKNYISNKMTTESYVPWSPWIRFVLVPLAFPGLRVILKMGEKIKQLINPFDNHSPDPFRMEGWFWPDGSNGNEKGKIKKGLWVDLPEERFLRLSGDEKLSVPNLDEIMGISGSTAWTWERLISALKAKELTPDEIARSHGLL